MAPDLDLDLDLDPYLPALARRDSSYPWKTKTPEAKVPATYPGFRQLCAIVRETLTHHPTATASDRKEAIKCRHVRLGLLYAPQQIPRAMDAVERAMRAAGPPP